MKSLSLGLVAVLMAGCAVDDVKQRTYDNNDLELIAQQASIQFCSCRFVMEMDDEYCREWIRVNPNFSRVTIDTTAKVVQATAFLAWTGRARFVDAKRGCLLE